MKYEVQKMVDEHRMKDHETEKNPNCPKNPAESWLRPSGRATRLSVKQGAARWLYGEHNGLKAALSVG